MLLTGEQCDCQQHSRGQNNDYLRPRRAGGRAGDIFVHTLELGAEPTATAAPPTETANREKIKQECNLFALGRHQGR